VFAERTCAWNEWWLARTRKQAYRQLAQRVQPNIWRFYCLPCLGLVRWVPRLVWQSCREWWVPAAKPVAKSNQDCKWVLLCWVPGRPARVLHVLAPVRSCFWVFLLVCACLMRSTDYLPASACLFTVCQFSFSAQQVVHTTWLASQHLLAAFSVHWQLVWLPWVERE
jgi:hypothetical protein